MKREKEEDGGENSRRKGEEGNEEREGRIKETKITNTK